MTLPLKMMSIFHMILALKMITIPKGVKMSSKNKILINSILPNIRGDVTNYPVRKINSDYITSHGEYVDIHVVDIPVVDLLNEVAARLDKELLISSNFPQRVSVNLNNATMDGLLDLLAKDIGINWHFDNNVYIIAPENQSFTPYFFPLDMPILIS